MKWVAGGLAAAVIVVGVWLVAWEPIHFDSDHWGNVASWASVVVTTGVFIGGIGVLRKQSQLMTAQLADRRTEQVDSFIIWHVTTVVADWDERDPGDPRIPAYLAAHGPSDHEDRAHSTFEWENASRAALQSVVVFLVNRQSGEVLAGPESGLLLFNLGPGEHGRATVNVVSQGALPEAEPLVFLRDARRQRWKRTHDGQLEPLDDEATGYPEGAWERLRRKPDDDGWNI